MQRKAPSPEGRQLPVGSVAPAPHAYSLGYRPWIEGLRAIAVLLVIAAHVGVPGLQGGFVGVDVFFILSGYLITALLVQEQAATGRIQLLQFYSRRLRRLLPALVVVVVASMAAAALLLAPFEQGDQASSARYALLWVSNLLFAFSELDYFGPSAASNLFLHTWSLGVEEQFYLVWPLLLLALAHAARGAAGLRWTVMGILVVTAASLLACIVLTGTDPLLAYYLPVTRAWQFGAGALVLLCGNNAWIRNGMRGRAGLTGWAGLTLIGLAALVLDRSSSYPGAWAILPTVGTVLVLLSCSVGGRSTPSGLLSARPLERIGLLSYGLYLWHWPVLLLGAAVLPTGGALYRVALVLGSLVLAAASFRWIENPIRHWRPIAARPTWVLTGSAALMAAAFGIATAWHALAEQWAELPEQSAFSRAQFDHSVIYKLGCDEWIYSARVKECVLSHPGSTRTAVLIGDSVAAQWVPALQPALERRGWRFVVLTKSSCPMVDVPYVNLRTGQRFTLCEEWRDTALAHLASVRPDLVLVGSASSYPYSEEQWTQGSARILGPLSAVASRVVVLMPTYKLPFDAPRCVARARWKAPLINQASGDTCVARAADVQATELAAWLETAAAPSPNVEVVDLNGLLCPRGLCKAFQGGGLVFRDDQHITASHARRLSEQVIERIGLPAVATEPASIPQLSPISLK